uniref:Uncharacterized protein n=1 Tax=Rangifer tarandus platyrhynchus TaxID=3082113 RepID=A0ACB0EC41_RANTA|nr:unnamed protein product [Rangifer tarandus platyrhynchus]
MLLRVVGAPGLGFDSSSAALGRAAGGSRHALPGASAALFFAGVGLRRPAAGPPLQSLHSHPASAPSPKQPFKTFSNGCRRSEVRSPRRPPTSPGPPSPLLPTPTFAQGALPPFSALQPSETPSRPEFSRAVCPTPSPPETQGCAPRQGASRPQGTQEWPGITGLPSLPSVACAGLPGDPARQRVPHPQPQRPLPPFAGFWGGGAGGGRKHPEPPAPGPREDLSRGPVLLRDRARWQPYASPARREPPNPTDPESESLKTKVGPKAKKSGALL